MESHEMRLLLLLACLMPYASLAVNVRVVGAANHGATDGSAGRVEVQIGGAWGTICDEFWDDMDATVVCKQLGHGSGLRGPSSSNFGTGTGTILTSSVQCDGTETDIDQCNRYVNGQWGTDLPTNCIHSRDATVVCYAGSDGPPMRVQNAAGVNAAYGRVEVQIGGVWGTICAKGDWWDDIEAEGICDYLGFTGTAVALKAHRNFAAPSGTPIWLNYQDFHNTDTACTSDMNVAVACFETCVPLESRLAGLGDSSAGRLEVNLAGSWGRVCRNSQQDMNKKNAQVACKQLGYDNGLGFRDTQFRDTPGDELNVVLDDLACAGTEDHMGLCEHTVFGDYASDCPDNAAAVACYNNDAPPEIRLVNGPSSSSGRVEVRLGGEEDGQWGTISDQDWTDAKAAIVCKALGIYDNVQAVMATDYYGEGTGIIWLNNLQCTGNEENIFDCQVQDEAGSVPNHQYDVGVICSHVTKVKPKKGPVAGGTRITLEGRGLGGRGLEDGNPIVLLGPTEIECQVDRADSTGLECVTPSVTNDISVVSTPLQVCIRWDNNVKMCTEHFFEFRPNPFITSISPRYIIRRGGIRLNVFGLHMDSVANPQGILYVMRNGVQQKTLNMISVTGSITSTSFVIIVPSLNLSKKKREISEGDGAPGLIDRMKRDLSDNIVIDSLGRAPAPGLHEHDVHSRVRREEIQNGYTFFVGFQLDGFMQYIDLRTSLPAYGEVFAHEDPIIIPFTDTQVFRTFSPVNDKTIEIKGERLMEAVLFREYLITLGSAICQITEDDITNTKIVCTPPQDKPSQKSSGARCEDGLLDLDVRIGVLDFVTHVGCVDYQDSLWDYPPARWGIIGGILAFLVLVFIFAVLCCLVRRRRYDDMDDATTVDGDDDYTTKGMVYVPRPIYYPSAYIQHGNYADGQYYARPYQTPVASNKDSSMTYGNTAPPYAFWQPPHKK
jgi:hypothetical protein